MSAPITLEQIDALFLRLSAETQLRLIDHLSDLTEYGDELGEGMVKAVKAYAVGHCSDEFEAEHVTGEIAYMGSSLDAWKEHCAKRDEYLRSAFGWLGQNERRAVA